MIVSCRRPATRYKNGALSAKALNVHERLCQLYGCPVAYFHEHDPLSELELLRGMGDERLGSLTHPSDSGK